MFGLVGGGNYFIATRFKDGKFLHFIHTQYRREYIYDGEGVKRKDGEECLGEFSENELWSIEKEYLKIKKIHTGI